MTRTREQMYAAIELRKFLDAAGLSLRVLSLRPPDDEGWPIVPGTYGQVEWFGAERDGLSRLYVFTTRRNIIPRLFAIPELHRWQTGDDEARFWLPADDHPTLRTVARVIRAYKRPPGAPPDVLARARRVA